MPVYNEDYWKRAINNVNNILDDVPEPSTVIVRQTNPPLILNEYSDYIFLAWLINEFIELGINEGVHWSVDEISNRGRLNLLTAAAVLAYYDLHDEFYEKIYPPPTVSLFRWRFDGDQSSLSVTRIFTNALPVGIDLFNNYKYPADISSQIYVHSGTAYLLREYFNTFYLYNEFPASINYQVNYQPGVNPALVGPQFNDMVKASHHDISLNIYEYRTPGNAGAKWRVRVFGGDKIIQITNNQPFGAQPIRIKVNGEQIQQINRTFTANVNLKNEAVYEVHTSHFS